LNFPSRARWYVVSTLDTIAAMRSLHRQGFKVDDGRNGRTIENIPLASDLLPGYEVWRPMAVMLIRKRVRGTRREEIVPQRLSLFPGYILAKFDPQAPWQWMLGLNGVAGVLSRHDPRFPDEHPRPYALDSRRVEALREEIAENGGALRIDEEGRRIKRDGKPVLLHARGARVLVTDGPFTSFPGTVLEDLLALDGRPLDELRVGVDIFGRTTPVSLAAAQVMPA
jgi:transcription antitermination factor NusG